MISKKDMMLRLIDLEAITLDLEERIQKLEHPKAKKGTKK